MSLSPASSKQASRLCHTSQLVLNKDQNTHLRMKLQIQPLWF